MKDRLNGGPLKKVALKDRVSELIKNAILAGSLQPGDRIVEMKLASDLEVGTTSVREALFELESQGFVTRVPNKGTFVTQLTKEDVEQILRVRFELEGLAAELLQRRASDADIAALRGILYAMRNAALAGDVEIFYRRDLEFHRTIWSLSGNRHLAKALNVSVVPLFAFFIMRNPSDTAELVKSIEWHGKVVDAIESRKDARRSMEAALQFFQEQENWMLFSGRTGGPAIETRDDNGARGAASVPAP